MGWLSLVMLLIQYGPVVFKLVQEIVALIKAHRSNGQFLGVNLEADLAAAVAHYKVSKDMTGLQGLLARLKAHRAEPRA